MFVAFALDWVLEIDRPIYFDWLDAGRTVNRWGPDWFNEFGRVPLLIVIPVVVFVIVFLRCRVVAIAYPLTIAVGGAIFLTLNWTVDRLRPPFSYARRRAQLISRWTLDPGRAGPSLTAARRVGADAQPAVCG